MNKDRRITFIREMCDAEMADFLWFKENNVAYRIRRPFSGTTEKWDLVCGESYRAKLYRAAVDRIAKELGPSGVISTLSVSMPPYGCVRMLCVETKDEIILPSDIGNATARIPRKLHADSFSSDKFRLGLYDLMVAAGAYVMQDNFFGEYCALCPKEFEDAHPLIIYLNAVGAKRTACLTCAGLLDGTSATVVTKAVFIVPPEPCQPGAATKTSGDKHGH